MIIEFDRSSMPPAYIHKLKMREVVRRLYTSDDYGCVVIGGHCVAWGSKAFDGYLQQQWCYVGPAGRDALNRGVMPSWVEKACSELMREVHTHD